MSTLEERLKKLGEMNDSEIDFSDIPETDEAFWRDAKLVMPEKKVPVSLRLDEDVLQWFRAQGRGYQTKINAVLRTYVQSRKSSQAP